MQNEIILKKVDNYYIGAIPDLGLITTSSSAEEVYTKLEKDSQTLETEWNKAGLSHLLKKEDPFFRVVKLEKNFKNFVVISLSLYFLGLIALGLVIKNSAGRISESLKYAFKDPSPERAEKNLEKFKKKLEIYKPYIKEFQKVLDEKHSDENR